MSGKSEDSGPGFRVDLRADGRVAEVWRLHLDGRAERLRPGTKGYQKALGLLGLPAGEPSTLPPGERQSGRRAKKKPPGRP